jgi:hypothetical protein
MMSNRLGTIAAAAGLLALTSAAQAQGFNPYLNSDGAQPFVYGNSPAPPPATNFDWHFSTPAVPHIESYVPALPPGPTGYPCTMPGCR